MVSRYEGLDDWMVTTLKAAKITAKRVNNSAKGLLDLDDLVQTGFVWALENEDKVRGYVEDDKIGALKAQIYRVMQKAVAKERAASTGCDPSDIFYYTVPLIEELLTDVWEDADRVLNGVVNDGQPTGKGPVNERNNRAAHAVDVLRALSRLDDATRSLLRQRYQIGLGWEEIGSLHGIEGDTARKRVRRALVTMLDLLGGESPWRNRRPNGNAHAQAITATTYDGSDQ